MLQILYTSWPCEELALCWLTVPQVDVVQITWPITKFGNPAHISGADKPTYFKSGKQIDYSEFKHTRDKIPQYKGVFGVT